MAAQQHPHCVVVGAGIVGASCAWHLVGRGAQVTVIDSEMPGQATSYGNAGCISTSSIAPFSYPGAIRQVPGWLLDPLGPMRIRWSDLPRLAPWFWRFWRAGKPERVDTIAAAQHRLMRTVGEDFDTILHATGAERLRVSRGMILLYGSEEAFAADRWHYDIRERFGLEWHRLSQAQLHELEPDIRLADGVAIHDPVWEHVLSPADLTRTIAEAAFAAGANWIHERVQRVESTRGSQPGGVAVTTSGGRRIEADWLVLATGVWTNALLRQLGAQVPITPKRGYHSMLTGANVALKHPVMQFTEYVVMTPMRDGLRLAGTAEFARVDAPPDYRRARSLVKHARRFLPQLEFGEVTEWMGQRPMMPDSMPVLGPLPGHPRVLCAFGHGHYGLTQGPTTGRIVADLVDGCEPHVDLAPFAAARFRGAQGR